MIWVVGKVTEAAGDDVVVEGYPSHLCQAIS